MSHGHSLPPQRTFWFNNRNVPFEPYKSVERFEGDAPKYGDAKIRQRELMFEFIQEHIKIGATKQTDALIIEEYNDRLKLYDSNPEWFI